MSKTCPTTEELSRLLSGCILDSAAETLIGHVDGCLQCQSKVEEIDANDSLATELSLLRGRTSSSSLSGERTPGGASQRHSFADAEEPALPTEIGPYRLVSRIAAGGMGTVYEAWHRRLGKPFALKLLHTEHQLNPVQAARIQREWRAHGRLTHPNIVGATDAGVVDGQPYLVTERIDGIDLSRLVAEQGPLLPADACEVARQAALGLQHAHDQGVVHGDVKPSNVMLERTGTAKVLDLGTASWHDRETSERGDAALHGTLAFMAPEQFDAASNGHPQSDQYSLGCTLYFLLTGAPPFGDPHARSQASLIEAHRRESPPPVKGAMPEGTPIQEGLEALVQRLLAKRAGDRFESMEQLAEGLSPFCQSNQVADLAAGLSPVAVQRIDEQTQPNGMTSLLIGPVKQRPRWVLPVACIFAVLASVPIGLLIDRLSDGRKASAVTRVNELEPSNSKTADERVWNTPVQRIANNADRVWPPGKHRGMVDGIVLRPTDAPNGASWQLETIAPRGAVRDIGWSADGKWLAATSADGHLRVWRWQSDRLRLEQLLCRSDRDFTQLAWHPSQPWIALASTAGIWLVDANDGSLIQQLNVPYHVRHLAWHPSGSPLAAATRDRVELIALRIGDRKKASGDDDPVTLDLLDRTPEGNVLHFDWSPGGDSMVAVSPRVISRWDWDSERFAVKPSASVDSLRNRPGTRVHWLPGGDRIAVLRHHRVELADAQTLHNLSTTDTPMAASLDYRDDDLGVVGFQAKVGLLDSTGGIEQRAFAAQQRGRPQVAWHPSGKCLAVGINGMIAVVDDQLDQITEIGSNNLVASCHGLRGGGACIVAQNGKVVVVRRDGSIGHCENVSRGSQRTLIGHTMVEPGLRLFIRPAVGERFEVRVPVGEAPVPDGKNPSVNRTRRSANRPLVESIFNQLSIYNDESGIWEHWMRNPGQADGVALSPDGKELACLDFDGTVKFVSLGDRHVNRRWKIQSLKTAHSLVWHDRSGRILVTGRARDRGQPMIVCLEPASGQEQWRFSDESLGPQVWCVPTGDETFVHSGQPLQERLVASGELVGEVQWSEEAKLAHHRVERAEGSGRFFSWSGRAAEFASDASSCIVAWDVTSLQPLYVTLGVGDRDWLTLSPAGQVIDATPTATKHLVWIQETTGGNKAPRLEHASAHPSPLGGREQNP